MGTPRTKAPEFSPSNLAFSGERFPERGWNIPPVDALTLVIIGLLGKTGRDWTDPYTKGGLLSFAPIYVAESLPNHLRAAWNPDRLQYNMGILAGSSYALWNLELPDPVFSMTEKFKQTMYRVFIYAR